MRGVQLDHVKARAVGHFRCGDKLRLDRIQIPSNVTRLIIAEDNDPEGRRARSKAWRAYRERGLALARMPPPEQYGDWADVLRPRS